MRRLRIAAPAQLRLAVDDHDAGGCWWDLPDETRAEVLGVLARLIASGVLDQDDGDG